MTAKTAKKEFEVIPIPVGKIVEDSNLRDPGWEKKVSELEGLISQQGLLQPIGVKKEGDKFKLIFGSRRLAACRNLGWKSIDAKIFKKASPREEFLWKFGENSARENLSPLEEAKSLQKAISEKLASPKELAKYLNKTQGYISQRLQLLKLPEEVQKAVEERKITPAHAREIARVEDEKTQIQLVDKAERMNTTDLKEYVDSLENRKPETRGRKKKEETAKSPSKLYQPREEKEVITTLGELDKRLKSAQETSQKTQSEYFRGLIRGITWSLRMGGTDSLFTE